MIQKMVTPLSQDVNNLRLENSINTYADTEGNEDFWDLYKAGLIKPQMLAIRNANPRVTNMELVQKAHTEARQLVNSITEKIKKDVSAKASGEVERKKNAITDKGGKTSVGSTASFKVKSISGLWAFAVRLAR